MVEFDQHNVLEGIRQAFCVGVRESMCVNVRSVVSLVCRAMTYDVCICQEHYLRSCDVVACGGALCACVCGRGAFRVSISCV